MNFRDLEYVLAVAKHGKFSHAASVCNVSQPALSNQIKKLEHELGAELFVRLNNEVRLTEFGVRTVAVAQRILKDAQRIRDAGQELRDPEALPLKIGMTPTLAPYLTKYFAELFMNLFPGMRVTLVEDLPQSMNKMVEDHLLDIALVAASNTSQNLDFSAIWEEPLFLAMRKDHPLSGLDSIAAEDVPLHDFIRLPHAFGYDLESRLPLQDDTIRANKRFDLSALRFETVCRAVCHTDDCTLVSALAAEQFKRDNLGLAFVPMQGPGNTRKLGAVTRQGFPRRSVLMKIGQYINATPPDGVKPVFNQVE